MANTKRRVSGWRSGCSAEELERRDSLVPRRDIMGLISISAPGELLAWIRTEAERRNIAVSWLAVELWARGVENYQLTGAPDGGKVAEYRQE